MSLALIILVVLAAGVLFLPREYILIPLILAAMHTTRLKLVPVGFVDLTILRTLIILGILRILARREMPHEWFTGTERWLLAWGLLTILSSVAHSSAKENPFVYRGGLVLDYLGFYFLVRCGWQSWDEVVRQCPYWVFSMGLLVVALLLELKFGRNWYVALGQDSEVIVRNARVRPRGPFAHAILAGTVGGVMLPLFAFVWSERRWVAIIGMVMCCAVVVACNSSGPIMTLATSLAGLAFWRWRRHLSKVVLGGLTLLIAMQVFKERPIWYLVQYVDFTGGSTGWYRAALLDAGIRHLGEWWAFGTDFTSHWMATGVAWSEDHADMVNHYLALGVVAGLPAVVCLIGSFVKAVNRISVSLVAADSNDDPMAWRGWCLGVAIFTNCFTFFSVSYFDQTYTFFILPVAMTGLLTASLHDGRRADRDTTGNIENSESSAFASSSVRL